MSSPFLFSSLSTLSGVNSGSRLVLLGDPPFYQNIRNLAANYISLDLALLERGTAISRVERGVCAYSFDVYAHLRKPDDVIIVHHKFLDRNPELFATFLDITGVSHVSVWDHIKSGRDVGPTRYRLELGYADNQDAHFALYRRFIEHRRISQRPVTSTTQGAIELTDDLSLLDAMLDTTTSSPLKSTLSAMWQRFCDKNTRYIKEHGLAHSRRDIDSPLYSFTGNDCVYPVLPEDDADIFEFCQFVGKQSRYAKDITGFSMALCGDPGHAFAINGMNYNFWSLNYYLRYAYVARFLNFDTISVVVELGSGAGRQVEILKKLHPHLTFLLFDVPPQLYVAERYLSTVFPSDCVSFRTATTVPRFEPGRIYFFGAWEFPRIANLQVDLVWNAASLQEMPSSTVTSYLLEIRRRARYIFLNGKAGGDIGNPDDTFSLKHFVELLPEFEVVGSEPNLVPSGMWSMDFCDSFWRRKSVSSQVLP